MTCTRHTGQWPLFRYWAVKQFSHAFDVMTELIKEPLHRTHSRYDGVPARWSIPAATHAVAADRSAHPLHGLVGPVTPLLPRIPKFRFESDSFGEG